MSASSSSPRLPLIVAGLSGATAVALGALGAHRLAADLAERGMTRSWETGSKYHLLHSLALLALAALIQRAQGTARRRLNAALWCWLAGLLLFSGSLYWYAMGGPRFLVYVTPIGGLILIAGWLLCSAAALDRGSE